MTDVLAFTITVTSLVVALAVLASLVVGRYRWRRTAPVLLLTELAVLALAVSDLLGLGDRRPAEPGTHLAYLATAVLVLPVAAHQTRRDDDRWAGALVVLALVVLAVVVVRLVSTGRPA